MAIVRVLKDVRILGKRVEMSIVRLRVYVSLLGRIGLMAIVRVLNVRYLRKNGEMAIVSYVK